MLLFGCNFVMFFWGYIVIYILHTHTHTGRESERKICFLRLWLNSNWNSDNYGQGAEGTGHFCTKSFLGGRRGEPPKEWMKIHFFFGFVKSRNFHESKRFWTRAVSQCEGGVFIASSSNIDQKKGSTLMCSLKCAIYENRHFAYKNFLKKFKFTLTLISKVPQKIFPSQKFKKCPLLLIL